MKTILAALVLATPLALTSCEGTLDDVFGEWSRPSGNTNTDPTPAVSNNYMEWDGTALAAKAIPTTGIQEVTDATTSFEGGFYIVKTDVTIPAPGILINADTKLILCDGATLTVNGYFEDKSSTTTYSLTIYGQENQIGKLIVNAPGGCCGTIVKDLEIHGGDINITGSTGLAAINPSGDISIYGGKVTATGGDADDIMTGGPGIYCFTGNIVIDGNAQVNAYGGAGHISNDNGGYGILLQSGDLTISGTPTIVATSGSQRNAIDVAGTLTMSGGDVTATAVGNLGNGLECTSNPMAFSGGKVTASGSTGADLGIDGTLSLSGGLQLYEAATADPTTLAGDQTACTKQYAIIK
ncbi:hypothetical protein [Prevotella sp. ne3005]|uniref:hypothetical protein n=1 Tax=Prevotella sp. ne3005 TaxID=1761887 RepID=UPI000B86B12F|nr:hypothetical protein [Prevotella sp. ne3005]